MVYRQSRAITNGSRLIKSTLKLNYSNVSFFFRSTNIYQSNHQAINILCGFVEQTNFPFAPIEAITFH